MKKIILFLTFISFNLLASLQQETEITESLEESCLIEKGINPSLAKQLVDDYNMENEISPDLHEDTKPIVYNCLGVTQSQSINSGFDLEGYYVNYPQTKRPEISL